ncbi:hypothetical protein CAEBREN_01747 [Caenorhabditis brenneri]|uniref:Sdz-33 F-box domain-containing protein n=1 Tax=Caenorhabditis brenneri TaxID=135651 RepID=G0P6B7_CAEBE|nr:hypothetical protein CAEBREN_01747 [Caenorhabditis brenneri]
MFSFQFFIENYKKPSKKLYLVLDYGNEEELELSDNLETNVFEEVVFENSHPVNFNLYNIFSCPIIDSYEKHFTNQDLNTFIKNWQLGLTNSHWRSVCIKISEPVELQDVLKDITVTYRDSRTVKRKVSVGYDSYWIFGGIDIQKHDGSATATIQWKDYRVNSEDSEVPIKLIRKYERNNGVIFDEEDELEEDELEEDQHDEVQHEEFQLEEEQLEEDELVEDQHEDDEHEEHELQAADLHANFLLWLKRFSQAEFSMYIW